MIQIPDKPSFTPNEIAYILNVSRETVYRWIRSGILKAEQLPTGIHRIARNELENFQKRGKIEEMMS